MRKYYTYILAILLPVIADCSDFRTFTDKQGRQMQAKINQVSGNDVFIERRDGLVTKVSAAIFSEDDQVFVRQWARQQNLKDGAIEARFSDKESEKTTISSGGIKTTKYDAYYEVVLKNTTDQEIQDIRLEYLMLKIQKTKWQQKDEAEGDLERKKGKMHLERLSGALRTTPAYE